ncbi:hypothetical protein B0H14DRAFT_3458654 [Mycena olivaceomarginata]|nr:hypothetical protein B0H14DRAFT_3458654 [Mycena olivaceomarginata]
MPNTNILQGVTFRRRSAANKPVLKSLAITAINYLVRVAASSGQHCAIGEDDVASTQMDRSSLNTLSIRFKSREKATLFCSLVEHYSPLPGQGRCLPRANERPTHSRTRRRPRFWIRERPDPPRSLRGERQFHIN